jgi:hypothetical protein
MRADIQFIILSFWLSSRGRYRVECLLRVLFCCLASGTQRVTVPYNSSAWQRTSAEQIDRNTSLNAWQRSCDLRCVTAVSGLSHRVARVFHGSAERCYY